MTDVYGQFLRWSVTESTPATMEEGNGIQTGAQSRLSGGGFLALEVHNILGAVSIPTDEPAANTTEQTIGALSTRSGLAAIPDLSDEHCIYRTVMTVRAGVATYLPQIIINREMSPFTTFAPPLLVSHKTIYPYVQGSDAGGTAAYFNGYIFYNYVDIEGALAVEALEAFR
jgi:hypothetical protein